MAAKKQYDTKQAQQESPQQAAPAEPVQAGKPAAAGGLTPEAIEQLKQLGELHDQNVLSDEEFARRRLRCWARPERHRTRRHPFVFGLRVDGQAATDTANTHTAKVRPTTIANQPWGRIGPLPAFTANGPTKLIAPTRIPIQAVHVGAPPIRPHGDVETAPLHDHRETPAVATDEPSQGSHPRQ